MDDPKALREVARRWRALAQQHDPSAAIALISGARQLEAQADALDGSARPARSSGAASAA